jgi:hypothetical protein
VCEINDNGIGYLICPLNQEGKIMAHAHKVISLADELPADKCGKFD